ncbi:hypothetical protein N7455_001718 [Penicillium solitum]|uniref:uncharacterized protein n=1 Tax=Penicillium solitum TaxID=60172 RepID=UPI0032C466AC|nr:hypothetical protein N7455_001718 [Penicillium solitum]
MASKRSYVFRVTGLSRKLLDEELKTALHDALNDNFADDERSHIKAKITIVPSYYKSDTERVALVQFRGRVPQFLRKLRVDPLRDCIITIAGLDRHTYNSKLSSHGVDTILDYGRELIEEIKKIRNTKECLVRAIQTMEKTTRRSHRYIEPPDFKNLIRDRRVVSFYETEQTRRLALLPDHVEDKVPLHADHSEVVKFDTRNAAGYRIALDKLRQFSKEAPSVVAARFTQTRPKPQPCSTVPFKKDPMFIGREAVISAIKERHKAIGQRHERVALVGLAGVRKTQTAIEYSYRVRESTPDMWVFWIHASNAARLEQGYQQIAAAAEVPGRDDPKMNILQLVYQWLCDARNGRWLMVLDNADDDGGPWINPDHIAKWACGTESGGERSSCDHSSANE